MRRIEKFKFSQLPYAVDLGSLNAEKKEGRDGPWWDCSITAVWFRRRGKGSSRVTVACIGKLWGSHRHEEPADAVDFLTHQTDGRYGGSCAARWDGIHYWGEERLDLMQQYLAVLRPMLDQFPAVPPGFDGWWTFH